MTMAFLTDRRPDRPHGAGVGRKTVAVFGDGAGFECEAVIEYDADIGMFRGEFTGLNGGADFYAEDLESLGPEAKKSLRVFLAVCEEQDIDPLAPSRPRESGAG